MDPFTRARNRLPAAICDPELVAAARGLDARLRLRCNEVALDVIVTAGKLRTCPAEGDADITLVAGPAVWDDALTAVPTPCHQGFTALQLVNSAAEVVGDPLLIAQARAVLERLLECLRDPAPPRLPRTARDLGGIRGQYVRLVGDGAYEVFYECAGSGPPVVFLHTAGADARQYQAVLADPGLSAHHRLIAFDLPFHGRSLPPEDWDGGAYCMDQARYLGWVVAFLEQMVGEPAILIGCSMGAAIALVVAAERPDLLRGVVALESPLRSPGRRNPFLAHAQVPGGLHNAAYVRGLMSPSSPEASRRRTAWIYAQGAPGVYAGDLGFYSDEFDGAVIGPRIDATRFPVHLMTGEYDYSAPPADGMTLSRLIPGSVFHLMPGLGHFPMSEDPDRFLSYLMPILAAIL